MSFFARPSTHRISTAPSGRARCRKCRRTIAKGTVRIETCAFVRPGRAVTMFRCGTCVDAQFAASLLSVYKRAERVPVDASVSEADLEGVRSQLNSYT